MRHGALCDDHGPRRQRQADRHLVQVQAEGAVGRVAEVAGEGEHRAARDRVAAERRHGRDRKREHAEHGAPEAEQHALELVGRERRHELQVEPGREIARAPRDDDRTRLLALGAIERGTERFEEGQAHRVHLAVVERDPRDVAVHRVRDPVRHDGVSWHLRGVDTKAK